MTEKEALSHTMNLCSKREYASGEIRTKLADWDIPGDLAEKIINQLVAEKFIDDSRYCRAFVNDKLKFAKWGKIKITYMLRQKQVDDTIIREALDAIDPETYENILLDELTKKAKGLKASSEYEFKGKLIQFASQKGFEYEIAEKLILALDS